MKGISGDVGSGIGLYGEVRKEFSSIQYGKVSDEEHQWRGRMMWRIIWIGQVEVSGFNQARSMTNSKTTWMASRVVVR